MLVFSYKETDFQWITIISSYLCMIKNMDRVSKVPGSISKPSIGSHELSLGVSRNVSFFRGQCRNALWRSLRVVYNVVNVVREKLYGERMCTHFVYAE
jgi:hypothetical protein